jgi:uncharacterized protein YodC (DUF2158 family)
MNVSEEIKAGDIVVLKSGGPEMTVKKIIDDKAECSWFEESKIQEHSFYLSEIKRRVNKASRFSAIGD